jgi:hypothetical protein
VRFAEELNVAMKGGSRPASSFTWRLLHVWQFVALEYCLTIERHDQIAFGLSIHVESHTKMGAGSQR